MNQQKLKMLIKFDQIKVVEEFYNNCHQEQPGEQIHLDLEVSDLELQELVETIYKKNIEQTIDKERRRNRALMNR